MKSYWLHRYISCNFKIVPFTATILLVLMILAIFINGSVVAAPDVAPGAFSKVNPPNGTAGLGTSFTITWGSSPGSSYYQYCYDTINNGSCDSGWINTGSTGASISGLSVGFTYYWQVQAVNGDGTTAADGGTWWNFSTAPGPFSKTSPANAATGQATSGLQLQWVSSSGATSYEFCTSTSGAFCSGGTWTDVGNNTSTTLGTLTPGVTYYWQVRAVYNGGTTEANGGSWNYFYTQPGSFGKSSPANGTVGVTVSGLTLAWGASTGATSYQFCFDTTNNGLCDSSWNSVGSTSASISANYGFTYYWHVRAVYQSGYTYSDSNTWWSFSTAPSTFSKSFPLNSAAGVSVNPTLIWGSSTGATAYEYCINSSAICPGAWSADTGNDRLEALSGLTPGATYYWQVRSLFNGGYTYADNSNWWSFTTLSLPAAFNKTSPTNGSTSLPLSFTISWGSSTWASTYQYCYDIVNDNICAGSWTSTGGVTSATIGGLNNGATYYWQVQAVNASGTTDANGGTWWSFSTAPAAFNKTTPTNNTAGLATSFNLIWGASTGATSYEYCYDTINNTTCDGSGTWSGTGSTSVTISGLDYGETYYWQVRAVFNGGYTYANSGTWWAFHTAPEAFNKTSPLELATGQATSGLQLQWGVSTGAASYEYCYSTSSPSCPGSWTSVSSNTSVTLGSLTPGATYYWQVRAVYASGYTYANNSTWWSFYTSPDGFSKTSPVNLSTGLSTSFSLVWGASTGATSYEFCYDTINDTNCNGSGSWISTGATSASISALTVGTTYYWQVRSVYQSGFTYANAGAWWAFSTAPGSFNKSSPANLSNAQPTSLTLQWGTSLNATSYEFCFDTSDDDNCAGWTPVGSNTSVGISGLVPAMTYYWHVKALFNDGETFSNGSATTFWSFSTAPGAFNKSSPADGTPGLSTSPTLAWNPSSGATLYQYCYDSSDDDDCSSWTSIGTSTSIELTGLIPGTTYYWQVRSIFLGGETYGNGSNIAFWSFSTAPGAFNKSLPVDGVIGQDPSFLLQWGASQNATSYEYCISSSAACTGPWNPDVDNDRMEIIGNLNPGTTYYWQIRSVFNGGFAYANDGSWWIFHTAPGAFDRISPVNDAFGQATSLTLTWGASQNATSYEYCYDTSLDIYCTGWTPTGDTSAELSGLIPGTIYSWLVRAVYAGGYEYADGVDTTFWTFSTAPGDFYKTSPTTGAVGVSTTPTLTWGTPIGYATYQFCYDTSDDDDCDGSWNATTGTSIGIGGLTNGMTYYWQVRSVFNGATTEADGGTWFSFSTVPGDFSKTNPVNGATGQTTTVLAGWTVSMNASSYAFCLDDTINNSCDELWNDVGSGTGTFIGAGLSYNTVYEWQIRATFNSGFTYANGGSWWTFTTQVAPPDAFGKTTPTDTAANQPTDLQLQWETSTYATQYLYCIDDVVNGGCNGSWFDASTNLYADVTDLLPGTMYEWQVRASNTTDTTDANDGTWWTFITRATPADFDKLDPVDGEIDIPINITLTWESSTSALSYAYCIDTTDDALCENDNWIVLGDVTSINPANLKYGATYYWHVKAVNASGTTFSNDDTWWHFSTMTGLHGYIPMLKK